MLIRYFLAILFIASLSSLGAQTTIELNLKMGQEFTVEETTRAYALAEYAEKKKEETVTMTMFRKFKVIDVSKDVYKIEVTLTSFSICGEEPSSDKICYESEKPNEDLALMGFTMSPFLNKSFFVYVTKKGDVEKIEGLQEIIKASENSIFLSESLHQKSLKYVFFNFNNNTLQKGDSWEKKTEEIDPPVIFSNKYTCSSISQTTALLDITGLASSNLNASEVKKMGITVKTELSGTTNGQSQFDVKSGLLKESALTYDLSGSMTNTMKEKSIEIPMKVKTVYTLKVK